MTAHEDIEWGRQQGVQETALSVLQILDANAPAKDQLIAIRKLCEGLTK